jgi:hypothetical protein
LIGFVLRVADSGSHEGDCDDGRECCGFFHLGFRFFKGILGFFGGLKENQGLGVSSVVNKFL